MSIRAALVLCLLTPSLAWADHPFITEDTGVLGKGRALVEIHGERARDGGARGLELGAKLAYGIGESVDLQAELPYLRERADGQASEGRGDLWLGLKWRFHDEGPLSLAVLPSMTLPTGRDEAGLGAGRRTYGADVVAAYELGRLEALAHAGWLRNRNTLGERESLRHLSFAVAWMATEALRLIVDLSRDTNPDPTTSQSVREALVGMTYQLSPDIDLGLGLKTGLSDAADDRGVRFGARFRW